MSDTNLPLLSTRSCHLPRNCLAWIILATCPSLEGRWCVACSYDIPLRWKGTNWKVGWTLPGLVSRLLLLLLVLDAIVSSWLLMVADGFPTPTCPKKIKLHKIEENKLWQPVSLFLSFCAQILQISPPDVLPCGPHHRPRGWNSHPAPCGWPRWPTHRCTRSGSASVSQWSENPPALPCLVHLTPSVSIYIIWGKNEKFHPSFGWTCDKDWQDKYILDTTKKVGKNVNWGFQHTHLHMEGLDEFRLLTSPII